MQSATWAEVKSQFGWKTETLSYSGIPAGRIIVYLRKVPGIGKFAYIPGISGVTDAEAAKLTEFLKTKYSKKAFALRLEINQPESEELLTKFKQQGWKLAKPIQYRHTVKIDLTQPEDDIWMNFKSRGRYEVLQAQKAGVAVTKVEPTDENLQKMYDLMQTTSTRNKFYIRDKQFCFAYWHKFREAGDLELFFAEHKGDLQAGAVIIKNGTAAWYKDGGSTRANAQVMAPRLLLWEVMKSLKKQGMTSFDLAGIADPKNYQTSQIRSIYVFKSAFSKQTVSYMPSLELPLSIRYALWPKAEKQWLRVYNLFAHNLWY